MLFDPRNNRARGRTAGAGEVLNVEVVKALVSLGADEVHDLPACHAAKLGSTARRRHRCFVLRHSPLPNFGESIVSSQSPGPTLVSVMCRNVGCRGSMSSGAAVTCPIFNILTRVHELQFRPFRHTRSVQCADRDVSNRLRSFTSSMSVDRPSAHARFNVPCRVKWT